MGVKKNNSIQNMNAPRLKLYPQSGATSDTLQGQDSASEHLKTRIWQAVALIPKGRVATYGQIAHLVGAPRHARFVGATLRHLPKATKLPWHRVVNANLRISQRGGGERTQRERLEAEGVNFIGARIPNAYRWETAGK